MAYNEELALRIRTSLKLQQAEIDERKMFGGICFMHKGKMSVGVAGEELMVRVLSKKMESVLCEDHVRPMDFTGKPMKEFIFVDSNGTETEEQLGRWIEFGIEHAESKVLESSL